MERGVSVEKEERREDWGEGGLLYVFAGLRAWREGTTPNALPLATE